MTSEFEKLQSKVAEIDKDKLYKDICKNIKKYRLEEYENFKNKKHKNNINPYSTENIAALLDYNHNHYKRFESETDSTKQIPLEKLVKLCIILNKNLDDFINKKAN